MDQLLGSPDDVIAVHVRVDGELHFDRSDHAEICILQGCITFQTLSDLLAENRCGYIDIDHENLLFALPQVFWHIRGKLNSDMHNEKCILQTKADHRAYPSADGKMIANIKEKDLMIRWGILGAGNIAHRFAQSLANEQDSVLYAISGRSAQKLDAFAEQFPCEKKYVGHDLLINDENVDAIYLALPHSMHMEWALKALSAHIPVLCEKPAAISEEQTRAIADCAKENDTLFMEAMKPRFVPVYAKLKQLLSDGVIGEIVKVYTKVCFKVPAEAFGKSYHTLPGGGGGALLDSGIYCASLIDDLLKGEPEFLNTYAAYHNGVDLYSDSTMKFENGIAEMETGFDRSAPRNAVITGTKGQLVVVDLHRPTTLIIQNDQGETIVKEAYENDDFYSQIHHFVNLIKEGKKESPIIPYASMIREAHILDLIRKQFTEYGKEDLDVLADQEKELSAESFDNADALALGNCIAKLALEYDRPVAVRIDRYEDDLTMFQYMMEGKSAANLRYMDGKKQCVKDSGHSSAWVYVKTMADDEYSDWKNDGVHLISGGAFPLYVNDEIKAIIQVSGLHEGKDHELIVRSLSAWQNEKPYTKFIKGIG